MKPTKSDIKQFREAIADPNTDADEKAMYRSILKEFSISETDDGKKEESTFLEDDVEVVKKTTPKKKSSKKTKKKISDSDMSKAKADIKKRTGKTEEECEKIIEEYKSLRTKTQARKKKETKTKEESKKRVSKLKKEGKTIKGTDEKTASATLDTTKKQVKEKIDKEIKEVEKKAKKEKKVVDKPKTEQKKIVEKKVEKKTEEIAKKVSVDTSAIVNAISTSLATHSKEDAKLFLTKLRNDIDKMIAKYGWGGFTQPYNIEASLINVGNNPTFAYGGEVSGGAKEKLVDYAVSGLESIGEDEEYVDDIHHRLFNTDYFIIGYYNAQQFMDEHDLDCWDIIEEVQEYEKSNFGETNTAINSEAMLNMWAYIHGYDLLANLESFRDAEHKGGYLTEEDRDKMISELQGIAYKKGGRTQGYDARQDESLGNRRGKQSSKKVSPKGRRDDSYGKWGKRGKEDRKISMAHGGKTQGYDARDDESIGGRHRGRHSQNLKDRRRESAGMEKHLGRRKYADVSTMDRHSRVRPRHTGLGSMYGFKKGGWVQKVVDSPKFRKGAFTKKADRRGLTPEEFMSRVLANPHRYDERTRRQAQFMKNIGD